MNYTAAQQDAISSRGENLLISAAAGSGKTRVLVDRIVDMIKCDHISLNQMLIVTFTNAAAGEMKARLRKSLQEAVAIANSEEKPFLLEQLRALADAHISTMHAFCISELRRFYHVLEIDPNFKVLPESTTTILREDALEKTMDAAYEEDDEAFNQLVEAYGGRNSDTALRDLIRSMYYRLQSQVAPLQWLDDEVERYQEPLPEGYYQLLEMIVEETCEAVMTIIQDCRDLVEQLFNPEKYYEMFNDDESIVMGLKKCLKKNEPIDAVLTYVADIKWGRKPAVKKSAPEGEKAIDETLKGYREQYKKMFKKLTAFGVIGGTERINNDRKMLYPHLKALAKLIATYETLYHQAKKDKEGLDFNDLEHEMLRLLEDEEARQAIRKEIQYIFFDEYQDANPIQEAIVEKLAVDNHLFFVGDVKQAIYRFRRADPNIFNRRYARYKKGQDGRLIFLSDNFRSRAEVLNFSNALFYNLMTPELGEVDYSEKGQALVCGGVFEADEEAVQCVALLKDEQNDESVEATWIAEEIERLVDSGRYQYGDIVILMRSPRSRLYYYEEALKQHRIPYYSDNSVVGFHNLEVRLLISALTVLNNDDLDHALLSMLLSPFGGLTDTEIATIRVSADEGSFSTICKAYMASHEDRISRKLSEFYEMLHQWRNILKYESLQEVAIRMVEESGYTTFLLGMDEGNERYQNVYAFIDMIGEYEKGHRYGLPGFLHYVKTLEERNMDDAMPGIGLSENDQCVRIMSIHKSKGLGFKVVFLSDMAHQFNMRDLIQPLVVDDDLGLAAQTVNLELSTTYTSFEKKMVAYKHRSEILSEEVRLLYVALTRAIDRLYLVTALKPKKYENFLENYGKHHANMSSFREGKSYWDWLATCLCDSAHPLYIEAAKPLYRWRLIEPSEKAEEEQAVGTDYTALTKIAKPDQMAEFEKNFHIRYAYEEDTRLPFKKTVTELSKKNQVLPEHVKNWPSYYTTSSGRAEDIPMPRFLRKDISFTATAMGTLIHQVMQFLPMKRQNRNEIIEELDVLLEKSFLTAEERAVFDIEENILILENFYRSDFVGHIINDGYNVEHEVSFSMYIAPYQIDGQIDLFFETDKGYEILDFKTDRKIRSGFYDEQLNMYAEALSIARGKPVVHKWLYWLRFNTVEEVQ